MARLLVQQTAYGAAPALQLQNDEQLTWLANALVLDPKVMSAIIYSEQGQRLAFAQSVLKSELELEPDSEELQALLAPYPPFVEPVTQEGKNLGYVEVRLDERRFFDHIKEAHELNMRQQQVMLLIAGIIGLLLSRSFSFKRAYVDRKKTRIHRLKKQKLSSEKRKEKHSEQNEQEETNEKDKQAHHK